MEISAEDRKQFMKACEKIVDKEHLREGIGTLQEKTVHAVLKQYLVPRNDCYEKKCGKYIADIFYDGEIIEIQTANFNVLRRKLDAFLPEYDVTIVYPIPATKWLYWIDNETGEISKKRKSRKKGNYFQAFRELYKIKSYLLNPNLHFRLLLIDMEEYRLLNGWSTDRKKGSERYDRIPIDIQGECMINEVKDFVQLIPKNLPNQFDSTDFKKASGLSLGTAQLALNVLFYVDAVKRVGKSGRKYLYESNGGEQ